MGQADSIFRWSFTIFVGVVAAFFMGALAGLLWRPLFWPVFILPTVFWIAVVIDGIKRQGIREDAALLAESRTWREEDLPEEFRFINRDTTLEQVTQKVGPYSRVRGEKNIRAFQFNLPYKCAVLIFTEPPFGPSSRVQGVKFYRDRTFIPF